ncbi:MAG: GNAT family N-acetyltransferase [Spirochaetota bacterium]
MEKDIKIKIIKKSDFEKIKSLYIEAGWWDIEDEKNPLLINKIVKGSFIFVGAFYKKELIGIARAISDGISDAYVQDVVVSKSFRNRGIGKRLVIYVLNYLKEKGINWIGLISTPDNYKFYEKLGFQVLEGFAPMIYKGK